MPRFAKKRKYVQAIQWTGEMSAEVTALLGDRKTSINDNRVLTLGNGWYATVGDWIMVDEGVEGIAVMSSDGFSQIYERVDEPGELRPTSGPTSDEHIADVREFIDAINAILIDGLRLSSESHPRIFHARHELIRKLHGLLDDREWVGARDARQRTKDRIIKEFL